MLLEVNSIFLHSKRLLFLTGKQNTLYYQLATVFMYATYVPFRLAPCVRALWYFWSNFHTIGWLYLIVILPATMFLFIHSCRLLPQLIRRDLNANTNKRTKEFFLRRCTEFVNTIKLLVSFFERNICTRL